jgi:hypothetical protein
VSDDDDPQYLIRTNIVRQAMEPGGVDTWARIDRRVPGEIGWVIVPQPHGEGRYEPGGMPVTERTIAKALRSLQGGVTLDDLKCSPEFIDQVDAILNRTVKVWEVEPSVSAIIVQIGLFGSVWYR